MRALASGLLVSPGLMMFWTWFELSLLHQKIAQVDPSLPAEYLALGPPVVDWLMTQVVPRVLFLCAIFVVIRFSPSSKVFNAITLTTLGYLVPGLIVLVIFHSLDRMIGGSIANLAWSLILDALCIWGALLLDRAIDTRREKLGE